MAKLRHKVDLEKSDYSSNLALSLCGKSYRTDPYSIKPKCEKCESIFKIAWDAAWNKQFSNPKPIF